jgi:2-phosphosulfolactate phosphatase
MFRLNTILSTSLFDFSKQDLSNYQIVIIDILRATTTCVVALENGAKEIIPVGSIEKALTYKSKDYLLAGERDGQKIDSFPLGNSPQEFKPEIVKDKKIVFTTTNGTKAIELCGAHADILISSYRNIDATIKKLIVNKKDVLLFCSGWKGQINIEDSLFAGELIAQLQNKSLFQIADDASHIALTLYLQHASNIKGFLKNASHVKRFQTLHIESDLDVCLKRNTYDKAVFCKKGIIQ